jgi:hypothetical protein
MKNAPRARRWTEPSTTNLVYDIFLENKETELTSREISQRISRSLSVVSASCCYLNRKGFLKVVGRSVHDRHAHKIFQFDKDQDLNFHKKHIEHTRPGRGKATSARKASGESSIESNKNSNLELLSAERIAEDLKHSRDRKQRATELVSEILDRLSELEGMINND